MKTFVALVLVAAILSPAAALAGGSTDAALGLGAFAVFNQILGGTGLFGGYQPQPQVVYPPVQQRVIVHEYYPAYPPGPVYAYPIPVYAYPAPVYYGPAPAYAYPAPASYGRAPVYAYPAPAYYRPWRQGQHGQWGDQGEH